MRGGERTALEGCWDSVDYCCDAKVSSFLFGRGVEPTTFTCNKFSVFPLFLVTLSDSFVKKPLL